MARSVQAAPSEQLVLEWLELLYQGDRVALGRLLTLVENQAPLAPMIYQAISNRLGQAQVVGFTGPPGAGKSTLVSAYAAELRRCGVTVGVVAIDPSSPFSGGAILGDRLRMRAHAEDPGVFVRSVASRGYLGGLSATAFRVIDLMDAAGREVILVETVGAGQSEVDIVHLADTNVVVTVPGYGDEIQAIKAGILEIADIVVVNKMDLGPSLAEATASQLSAGVAVATADRVPPVLCTSAQSGVGVAALAQAIEAYRSQPGVSGRVSEGRSFQALVAVTVQRLRAELLAASDGQLDQISADFSQGVITPDEAFRQALAAVAAAPPATDKSS
ncbi:MAG: methylmalonyl Co-A mutase-associated GTPase MeaB [Gammaproteobacteria bacterium]|nr:methylmalonyl Co-A mutase-associated GTPase MeaB [Gammaproteobacteria bacterium]